jgi:hypothetical protein
MLFSYVLFLGKQTWANGFFFLCIILLCFHFGSCCEIMEKKRDSKNVGSH